MKRKLKNEQGITLVALILIIIVLIILAGVSITTGTQSLDTTRLKGFYTQLEIIQKRVDDIAATNENYLDDDGNVIYLKNQGADLTEDQKSKLQTILNSENISVDISNFRYFTVQDLKNELDLIEMEYNVFIDFENRIIVSEDGIKVGDKIYYVLESAAYFVEEDTNKNIGTIESLDYRVTSYIDDKYKVTIIPSNTVGDVEGIEYVKYKKTTTKYWQISDNTEMIVNLNVEYNVVYIDANDNSLEKIIKVEYEKDTEGNIVKDDEGNNKLIVIEIIQNESEEL